ncbi:MAG TPA: hypothetical protein VGO07_01825 [Candidatus Saccharimonadales bacterium]|nr:hypothetical protein [Candidatus Saccharimonadales bacterium]
MILIVVAALGAGGIWLLLPQSASFQGDTFYSPLGAPTTIVDLVLAIGGGVLFLRALRNFKQELKPAWRMVALAQFAVGVLTITFPIIEYYYLWPNVWWNMSSYLPYLVGSIFMYLGMRKFYKLLELKSRITSVALVSVVILIGWGLHAFIPHIVVWTQFNEHQYDLFELVPFIPVICYSAAAYMALRIRTKVGKEYSKSFGWLAVGLGLQAASSIIIGVLEVTGYENWYFASRAYEIPVIVGDIGILTAAYYFNVIGLPGSRFSLWRRLTGRAQSRAVTSVDIVVYVAGMVSDVNQIDGYLDGMRIVTSQHQTGAAYSESDQQKLYDVYRDIEKYLVTKERLRSFDAASLHANIAQHFNLDKDNSRQTFWPRLTA